MTALLLLRMLPAECVRFWQVSLFKIHRVTWRGGPVVSHWVLVGFNFRCGWNNFLTLNKEFFNPLLKHQIKVGGLKDFKILFTVSII